MKLFVAPLSLLDETVRASGARSLIALLSEEAAYVRPAVLEAARCLRLTFHDIAQERPGLTAPNRDHVDRILDFARRWDRQAPLLIHCHAGISRSTAAAYAIACALRPDRTEDEIAGELRRLSPSATPNPLIVAHADAALGRNGRMAAAIRGIGRGAEAFEGSPFHFDLG